MNVPARKTIAGEELAIWSWNNWRPTGIEEDYEITGIEGEVPRELFGTLYRNGPSQKLQPDGDYTKLHFFDGDGLVHAFRFEDGRVWYRDRFVRNSSFLSEARAGRANQHFIGPRVATPDPAMPRRQSNTNVLHYAGRLLAMVENGLPFEIDARTLDPVGDYDFGGKLLAPWISAHPKIDGRTGQMLIHGYYVAEPYLQVYVVEPDGSVSLAEPVSIESPFFLHDLAITEGHFVVPVQPIRLDVRWEGGRPVGTYGEWMTWSPDRGLRFAVVGREKGAPVRWFRAPNPYAVFHVGNAWESDGKIHLDAYMYKDGPRKLEAMRLARRGIWLEGTGAHRIEYELDLGSGSCVERQASEYPGEWPRVDDRVVGYRNRFGYAIEAERDYLILANSPLRVVKYDRDTGRSWHHDFGEGFFPGEPVFVPRTAGSGEDDGVLLTVVYDARDDASFLAVLDARDVGAAPLCKLHLRHRVPAGFHGNWAGGVV